MPDPTKHDDRDFDAWFSTMMEAPSDVCLIGIYSLVKDVAKKSWREARQNTVGVEEVRELIEAVAEAKRCEDANSSQEAYECLVDAANFAAALQAKIGGQR